MIEIFPLEELGNIDNYTEIVDGKSKFSPALLARAILGMTNIVKVGDNNELRWYNPKKGVYEPNGEQLVVELANHVMGNYYKSISAEHVTDWIVGATHIDRKMFDSMPDKLNVRNGVLDVKTWKLEPKNPNYYFLSQLDVDYDPEAQPDKFISLLKFIYETNPEAAIDFLEYSAYGLIEKYPYKKAAVLVGPPDSMKTTLIRIISRFYEGTYATVSLHELCDDKFAPKDLYGMRMDISDELEPISISNVGKFKKYTGSSPIRAEGKYEHAFKFINTCKFIFGCNELPMVEKRDDFAFWGRFIIIEHKTVVTKSVRVVNYWDSFTDKDMSGILNLLLLFRMKMIDEGFDYEKRFDAADIRQKWLDYTDERSIHDFFKERMEVTGQPSDTLEKDEVYSKYVKFCHEHEQSPKDRNKVLAAIKTQVGVGEGKKGSRGSQVHIFKNVRFRTNAGPVTQQMITLPTPVDTLILDYLKQLESSINMKGQKGDVDSVSILFLKEYLQKGNIGGNPAYQPTQGKSLEASSMDTPDTTKTILESTTSIILEEATSKFDPIAAAHALAPELFNELTWATITAGLKIGVILGDGFSLAPEQFRMALAKMLDMGDIFRLPSGGYKFTKPQEEEPE